MEDGNKESQRTKSLREGRAIWRERVSDGKRETEGRKMERGW